MFYLCLTGLTTSMLKLKQILIQEELLKIDKILMVIGNTLRVQITAGQIFLFHGVQITHTFRDDHLMRVLICAIRHFPRFEFRLRFQITHSRAFLKL